MDDNKTKASPAYLIVNADELNRLIRENIALKKELRKHEFACLPCDFCKSSAEYADVCTGDCNKCGVEWRGIVKETEPTPEEEAELRNRLLARERK